MDSKRPHEYRALRQCLRLLAVGCWLLAVGSFLTSCSWVKDDTDDCPTGFWLSLHYTYNILDVEAAPRFVEDAYVYVYGSDGAFVKRFYVTRDVLEANDYRVRIEGLEEGDYRFVVWSGIGSSQYTVSGDTQTIGDFRLTLASVSGRSAQRLTDLYYGSLSMVHYEDAYAVHDVELMKNTNQLACLVVPVSDTTTLSLDEYNMKLTAANSTLDGDNRLLPAAVSTYEPYEQDSVTIDDPEYGVLHGLKFGISTLRLMSNSDSRLIFERKDTGQQLFSISIPEYVGMIGSLYTNLGRELSVQEYLDRQDFYTIVFFLSGDLDQLLQLQVNSWRLRANYHLKL